MPCQREHAGPAAHACLAYPVCSTHCGMQHCTTGNRRHESESNEHCTLHDCYSSTPEGPKNESVGLGDFSPTRHHMTGKQRPGLPPAPAQTAGPARSGCSTGCPCTHSHPSCLRHRGSAQHSTAQQADRSTSAGAPLIQDKGYSRLARWGDTRADLPA